MRSSCVPKVLLKRLPVLLLVLLAGLLSVMGAQAQTAKRLVGYYPSWAKYNDPAYTAAQIPYAKLTHINHAFAVLHVGSDGTIDFSSDLVEPALFTKAHAAGVKVLLSIGGGDGIQGPRFNKVAAAESTRQIFVKNVHQLLSKYGYDGVDIDWEVPNPADRVNCTVLMQELRNELPSPWLITMALPSDPRYYGQGFDVPAIAPLLDFLNVMTYDFYGPWSGATGLVSPLYQDPADPQQVGGVERSMELYTHHYGVPPAQINIGTPFYGYEWDGIDMLWGVCGDCNAFSANYAPYIKARLNQQGWALNFDGAAGSPYLTNSTAPGLITFDGVGSTAHKTDYVMSHGFGGMFMWELSADFDGHSQDLMDVLYTEWKKAK
jgi:chitinase